MKKQYQNYFLLYLFYFDKIISSEDCGYIKESNEFWSYLNKNIEYNIKKNETMYGYIFGPTWSEIKLSSTIYAEKI